jgi:type IX secretion system PorP/SprF family membrane protein
MKKHTGILFILFIPLNLYCQMPPVTSQYVLNPLTINPAYSGYRSALNLAAFYRKQWVGVSGSPETMTFAADAPLMDNKLGLGFFITNDKIGVTKDTKINTSYAYKINVGKGLLSLGLGAGLITSSTAWSELVVVDQGDELYLAGSQVFIVPAFSFGAYYSFKNYFAGFSIPALLDNKFNYNTNKYSMDFNPKENYYMLNTGYVFNISRKISLFPSALITYSPVENLLFDINAVINYGNRLWTGISYRNERSATALLQFSVNRQMKMAYTYDFGVPGNYSNGSHEIMIRYEFTYMVDVVNPLIF